jgi:purine-binding chemotaxis protein CheW
MAEVKGVTKQEKYIQLILDDSFYGVALSEVLEILEMTPLTELPFVPEYVRGVMNLRGQMVPVIDLSLRFGQKAMKELTTSCIIVFQNEGNNVGVIVDAMGDIVYAHGGVNEMKQRDENPFVKGVICGDNEEDRTMLLDIYEVFKK